MKLVKLQQEILHYNIKRKRWVLEKKNNEQTDNTTISSQNYFIHWRVIGQIARASPILDKFNN